MPDRLNRHDLTDEEWERLRVLLPSGPQQRGGRWADHRTVINGIFFRTRAGCPWRDLPEGFGNWKTVYNRHRRWSLDGGCFLQTHVNRAAPEEGKSIPGIGRG